MNSNHVEVQREVIIKYSSMMSMQRVMKTLSLLPPPECMQKIYTDRDCIREYDTVMNISCIHNEDSWKQPLRRGPLYIYPSFLPPYFLVHTHGTRCTNLLKDKLAFGWPVSEIISKNFSLHFDIFPKLLLMHPQKLKVCCKCLVGDLESAVNHTASLFLF